MKFTRLITSMLLALFACFAVAFLTGIPAIAVAVGLALVSLFVNKKKGMAYGLLVELWTGELLNHFRFDRMWMSRVPDQDNYVNNNVIHLVDVGADPEVLINNTTYPIETVSRTDSDVAVALDKLDTKNTKITDDELYALPYDKEGSVINQHRVVLEETGSIKGLHALAPAANGANTPVIETSGANDTEISRKLMVPKDMAKMKLRLDNLKVPKKGRVGVLASEHIYSLMDLDTSFRDKYVNTKSGELINHYGFELYEDVDSPLYDAAGDKKAFGASEVGTDRKGSVFFYAPRTFKAKGTAKMYYRIASIDPENRETRVGFRIYHIVLPKKNLGFGAIISAPTA